MAVNRKFPEYVILVDPITLQPYVASGGGGGIASSVKITDSTGGLITGGNPFPITGTVTVGSLPSVTISSLPALPTGANTIGKVDQGVGGSSAWKVDGTGGSFPVTGSVSVSGSVTVTGTVTANAGTGTLSVAQSNLATTDYDTGAGTVTQAMIGLALPAAGGPVAGGTATNPLTIAGAVSQSGTWTVQQGGAPWSVSQSGTWNVAVNVSLPAGPNVIGGVTQSGTWNVTVNTPLPTGSNVIGRVDQGTAGVSPWATSSPGVISNSNSIFTPLGANAVFTGTAEDITGYACITVTVFTDIAPAGTVLFFEQSADNVNWDTYSANTINPGTINLFRVTPHSAFFRVRYVNGTSAQATFRLRTILRQMDPTTSALLPAYVAQSGTWTVQQGGTWSVAQANPPWSVVQGSATPWSVSQSGIWNVNVNGATGTLSTLNSTANTLGANGVFTGTSEDVSGYAAVVVAAFADPASAPLGMTLQFSEDNANWDFVEKFFLGANVPAVFQTTVKARYFRVVYTNDSVVQNNFRLQTYYRATPPAPAVTPTLGSFPAPLQAAQHTIAIPYLYNPAGTLFGPQQSANNNVNGILGGTLPCSNGMVYNTGDSKFYPALSVTATQGLTSGVSVPSTGSFATNGTAQRQLTVDSADCLYVTDNRVRKLLERMLIELRLLRGV